MNSWELLTLGFLIGSTINEKGAGSLMIKGHFMMGPRLVILIKGIDIDSPQVLNEVNNIAFGQYSGKFAELAVIGDDQSSRLFKGI
ncbi:hypothetical protein [Peribacillus sp. NPDC097895]|uniref:hypothetical protein n=1 Tax=Peribacillus sp. NPDC097895 TaxID=3390619 RepID=UPI003CFF1B83